MLRRFASCARDIPMMIFREHTEQRRATRGRSLVPHEEQTTRALLVREHALLGEPAAAPSIRNISGVRVVSAYRRMTTVEPTERMS